jgi:hypothetical protein
MNKMTPIEAAARAIAISRDGYDYHWRGCLIEVRLVLDAIRQPSEAMVHAAVLTFVRENGGIEHAPFMTWQAMIDAALTEGPD